MAAALERNGPIRCIFPVRTVRLLSRGGGAADRPAALGQRRDRPGDLAAPRSPLGCRLCGARCLDRHGVVELWRLDLAVVRGRAAVSVIAPLARGWHWSGSGNRTRSVSAKLARPVGPAGEAVMAEVFLLAVILVGVKGVGIGTVEVSWGLQVSWRSRAFAGILDLGLDCDGARCASLPSPSRDRKALKDGQMSSRRSSGPIGSFVSQGRETAPASSFRNSASPSA